MHERPEGFWQGIWKIALGLWFGILPPPRSSANVYRLPLARRLWKCR